jgi:response regulator RpfG family c-di-GMP phosphodiesterase
VQLASPVEIFSRRKDAAAAMSIARTHRGTQFDPAAVDLFCDHVDDIGGALSGYLRHLPHLLEVDSLL